MSWGIGHRCGLDSKLLWLWCRPASIAPIEPLAWESPWAVGVAQEMAKRQKKKINFWEFPLWLSGYRIWLGTMRLRVWSLASFSELRIQHCCRLWCSCRHSSDMALLWLWHRPAAAAPIHSLAWEPAHATGVALKRPKENKTKQKNKKTH